MFLIGAAFVPNQERFKFVWLTQKDWKELEKISYVGKNYVTVVYKTTRKNFIHKVQYQSRSQPFTEKQVKKLKEILKKYE